MSRPGIKVKSRNEAFVQRAATRIWQESPGEDNPYVARGARCHGYDLLELMEQRSFVDVLYLLFRGELPDREQSQLLETLMIAMINPGPRHPASRAAVSAGVGKTDPVHILPIALTILGGDHLGAGAIDAAMRFLRKHLRSDPGSLAEELLRQTPVAAGEPDWQLVPGFGSCFGGVDHLSRSIAGQLLGLAGSGAGMRWGHELASVLEPHGLGWLRTGVAAAVLVDLGFQPRAGCGLFQLLNAPGLLAHGLEFVNKPITAVPFVDDEHYVFDKQQG